MKNNEYCLNLFSRLGQFFKGTSLIPQKFCLLLLVSRLWLKITRENKSRFFFKKRVERRK